MKSLLSLITLMIFSINVNANTCATAIAVGCGTNETGTTVGEPNTAVGTCSTAQGTGGMQWYTFTGDGNAWTFETVATGGQYDTKIWVFSGTCGTMTCVTGNDDGGAGTLSLVNFTATLGTTYYVVVGGFNTNEGNYDLNITATPCVPPTPMTYTSSTVTQTNTSTVETCDLNQEIIGIEVVTSGILTPIDITQLRLKTNGSTAPVTDISNISIYYTGTSSTFGTTTYFGSAAPLAVGTNIFVNGTQTLREGTNYFWMVYDLNSSATIGNLLDARCNRITVDGSTYVPTTTNPVGTRSIVGCISRRGPGGVGNTNGASHLNLWLDGNAGVYNDAGATLSTNGQTVQQWNDQSGYNHNGTQTVATAKPTYAAVGLNNYPGVTFTEDVTSNSTVDYLDLSSHVNSVINKHQSFFLME